MRRRLSAALQRTLVLVIPMIGLASVAMLNGYPLVHSDTGAYVRSSFTFEIPRDRPVFYSMFLWLSRAVGASLWSTVLLQSLLAALLIQCFVQARQDRRAAGAWRSAAITLLLIAVSCVAWVSSIVMADLFTGLLFVAVMTLVLDGRLARRGQALFLVLVIAFIALVHSSNLIILPLFLICMRALLQPHWRTHRRAYGAAWIAFALALVALPAVNGALSGRMSGPAGSQVFLLARWIELGAVGELLDERCTLEPYALCADRDRVRSASGDWFLWAADSPLTGLGGFDTPEAVTWPILRDTWRYHWAAVVRGAGAGFWAQLNTFSTGSFHEHYGTDTAVDTALHAHFPREYNAWQGSLQQRAALRDIGLSLDRVHRPVVLISALALLLIALPRRSIWPVAISPTSRLLARAVLLFVLVNAAVCGALTSTHDRYGRRVVWLLALVLAEIVAHEWDARRRGRDERSTPPVVRVVAR